MAAATYCVARRELPGAATAAFVTRLGQHYEHLEHTRRPFVEFRAIADRAEWYCNGVPDGIITPLDARGVAWDERVLEYPLALVLDNSRGEDTTLDAASTVTQVLAYGVLLCICRASCARERAAAGHPERPGLREPVMVAAMAAGWREMTRETMEPPEEGDCRVWLFRLRDDGYVSFWRSWRLTVEDALTHAYTHVYMETRLP